MKNPKRFPHNDEYARLVTEVAAVHDFYGQRGFFRDPRSFHPAPPPIGRHEIICESYGKMKMQRLAFHSGYQPLPGDPSGSQWMENRENQIAYGWQLVHDDDSERPWIICVHGLGMGIPRFDLRAFWARRLFEKLGCNLLFPLLPLHGLRRGSDVPRGALLSYELLQTVHGLRQGVWDIRRLIQWLKNKGAKQIGLCGVSIGAYVSALLSGLEKLEFVIAGIPLCDVPELFLGHAPKLVLKRPETATILGAEMRDIFSLVSPLLFEPIPSAKRRFIFAGRGDRISTVKQAETLWQSWDEPAIQWFDGGHLTYLCFKKVRDFVEDSIHSSFEMDQVEEKQEV